MIQKIVAGEQAAYEILQGALDGSPVGSNNRQLLWKTYFYLLTSMTSYRDDMTRRSK